MKLDRIIWGILFLFVGGVILLDNFDVINFHWRNVWQFWPVFLVIIGVNMLVGKKNSQVGGIITISVLLISLAFLFWKGQQPRQGGWFRGNMSIHHDNDDWVTDTADFVDMTFVEDLPSVTLKTGLLDFKGGGTTIDLNDTTEKLMEANAKDKSGRLQLKKEINDASVILKFDSKNRNNSWKLGDASSELDLKLNKDIEWDMKFELGAGSLDMDLSQFKINSLDFKGGASSMNVKLGNTMPTTNVKIKAGVADVSLNVPTTSGCRIVTKMGLSSRDLKGFTRISKGVYETEGYANAVNKIVIEFEGGLANFNVDRY